MRLSSDGWLIAIVCRSVLHLSEVERETGQGVDRDDLITWYLEQKESQFESVAELEHEKELIGKALTKLAKVCCEDCRSGMRR
jgi:hypothetical protein